MKKFYVANAEIPVVEHCNLNCSLCNSHAYLIEESNYPLDQFKADIDVLSKYIHFGILTFMGGEPLLCKNLDEYISYAKSRKMGEIYRVLTNGILYKNMSVDLMKVMDVLEISHYPQMKESADDIQKYLEPLAKKYKFTFYIKNIGYFNKIDTTSITETEAQEGYNKCSRIFYGCSIFDGYYYKCMRPKTTNLYLEKKCGITSEVNMREVDGLKISDDGFRERFQEYFNRKEMLVACKYCLMGLEDETGFKYYVKHKAMNNKLIVRLYYKHRSIYHGYKNIRKLFQYDEGAHTSGNDYVKTEVHDVSKRDKQDRTLI